MDACGFAKHIPTGRGKASTPAAAALRECPAQSATPAMEPIRRRCRPVLSKMSARDPETARSASKKSRTPLSMTCAPSLLRTTRSSVTEQPRGGLWQLKLTQGHRCRRPSYPRKVPLPGPCDLNRCAQNDPAATASSSPMRAYASSGIPGGRLTICSPSFQGLGGSNRSKPAGTACADAGAIGAVAATNAVDPMIKHMNGERKNFMASNRVMIVLLTLRRPPFLIAPFEIMSLDRHRLILTNQPSQ